MVGKLLGGGLVLLGTALWCRDEIQARRRETDRAAELAAALGEMAAELLIDLIVNGENAQKQKIMIEPELVEGTSCRRR